ncbi:MAG TPA: 4'-phosphopantetheinyl transferase superfamily protein [Acidobacteriota bacterium]|nr:4'-phosphopantetheinyl transferase superfamily protein [Acidobacteriota bacterium]HQP74375.1 4'-phosphopantetheinyl transferase superfamily protein [Acidobacteriota bacterium]
MDPLQHPTTLWLTPPPAGPPAADELHVWRAGLNWAPDALAAAADSLSSDERVRAARLRLPAHRDAFVAARVFLRAVLARCLGADAAELRFGMTAHGKPYLTEPAASLCFNLAHSGGFALLAVSVADVVGVDVERVRTDLDLNGIARRFFRPEESAALAALPAAQRTEAFFAVWTRKEALLKALGKGIAGGVDRYGVTVDPGSPARVVAAAGGPGEAACWWVADLAAGSGYRAAVAAPATPRRVLTWAWPGPVDSLASRAVEEAP